MEWLYRENSMQLKIFKIDPPGLATGLFDLRIGSGVFLSAIASSRVVVSWYRVRSQPRSPLLSVEAKADRDLRMVVDTQTHAFESIGMYPAHEVSIVGI